MKVAMDLGDLNIVAIAPTANVQPKRKKKNNKYERRRQKAKKARENKLGVPAKTKEKTDGQKEIDPDLVEKVQPQSANPPDSSPKAASSAENEPANTERESPSQGLSQKETATPRRPAEEKQSTPEEQPKVESSKPRKPEHFQGSNTRDDPANTPSAADLEHAKYMAEFHARPMELDRRSGARSSTIVSKSSKHLFTKAKDWNALNMNPRLIHCLSSKMNLDQPTSIQSRTIQIIQDPKKQNQNVLVHSETGSGKTLAYLLPILQQLGFGKDGTSTKRQNRKELGTKCIILCPTRELASQTLEVVDKLCQSNFAGWMVPGGLLGGDSRSSEKSRIRKGLAIIVATPGRLLDHLNKTDSLLMNLKGKLQWLVLDEADRLLDMGLGDQVRQIVQLIRANEASKSQPWWRSILVSATVTASVKALAKERMLCGDQSWVWVKAQEEGSKKDDPQKTTDDNKNEEGYSASTPRQLAQFHITVTAKLRLSTLISFLVQRVSKGETTVVFMGTCATVDYHHRLFESMEPLWESGNDDDSTSSGLFGSKGKVFKLHGSIQHSRRNQTLKLFEKATNGAVLLTTDVSARGLNLHGVDWTVQYDPPCEIADYVHRVGRVARAGKAGHSLLFLLPSERRYLDVLQTKGITSLEPLSLATTLNKAAALCPDWTNAGLKFGGNKELKDSKEGEPRRGNRTGEHFAAEVQRRLEDCIVQDDVTTRQKWKEKQKADKKRKKDTKNNNNKPKEGELLELARDAFMSFLRAYPTKKENVVRSIFSARALHLGHIARSFALKEPPKALVSKHKQNQKASSEVAAADQLANLPKSLQFNEYENNLVSISDDDDDDDEEYDTTSGSRPRKRSKHENGQAKNARTLLLENARKLEANLMDFM